MPFSASVSLSLKRALAGVQLALGNPHEKTGRQASWAEADVSRKEGPKTPCLHDAGALTAPQAALGGRGAAGALIMSDHPQILVHCFRKLSPLLKHLVMGFSAERSRGLLESRLRLRLAGRGLCWSTSFQNAPKSRWTTSNGKTPTSYPFSGSCLFFHLSLSRSLPHPTLSLFVAVSPTSLSFPFLVRSPCVPSPGRQARVSVTKGKTVTRPWIRAVNSLGQKS